MTGEISEDRERLYALVVGRVQGVGFRAFVQYTATSLGLHGWVRNRWDGTVELTAEGERQQLDELLQSVRRGPRASNVTKVSTDWHQATGEFNGFRVRMTA